MANPTISIDSTHIRSPSLTSSLSGTFTPPVRSSLDHSISPSPSLRRTPSTSSQASISLHHRRASSSVNIDPSIITSAPGSPNPSASGSLPRRTPTNKNRSALRQFYGLSAGRRVPGEPETLTTPTVTVVPEIDREGFDAQAFVENLCRNAELKELLRVENELVNEIRGFDGERKALVYDNYSKLISATDTIRKMRSSMEPLTPTTSTLEPAISHIAQISTSLTNTLHNIPPPNSNTTTTKSADVRKRKQHQQVVKWALSSPERIKLLVQNGKREEAEKEWSVVRGLLDRWGDKGVKGVEELREKGETALRGM